jgi:hypothetical protein
MRYIEVLAYANRRRILHFTMPRDSGGSLGGSIVVDAMPGTFSEQNAAI